MILMVIISCIHFLAETRIPHGFCFCFFFSSPEPKAQGELFWSALVRPSSVVCPSSVNIYLVNTIQATLCIQSSWNFVRMFVLIKFGSSSNMGHIWSKTRSVGQIIKKPCEHSRGHSFCSIFIKLAQNDHLDNISVKFEYGSCWVKN